MFFISRSSSLVRLRAVPALCVAASAQTQPQDAPLEAVRCFRKDQNHEHRHHQGHNQNRGGGGSAALLGSQRSGAPGQGSRPAVTPLCFGTLSVWVHHRAVTSPQGHTSRLKYLERLHGETSVEAPAEAPDSTETEGTDAHTRASNVLRFTKTQRNNESGVNVESFSSLLLLQTLPVLSLLRSPLRSFPSPTSRPAPSLPWTLPPSSGDPFYPLVYFLCLLLC